MQKDINILNISKEWTHFWAGSLDTHNLTNPDYVKSHPSIVDHEMNEVDENEYSIMRMNIIKKYGCTLKGRYISGTNSTACVEALKDLRNELAIKSLNGKDIFSKDQVNQIFNAVMSEAAKLSKKYKCPFKGFRFAINGGRSVNSNSASICTLEFLMKKKDETFTDMIKRCVEQFAFYIFCYSESSKLNKWKANNGHNWEAFKKWWNIEQTSISCCDPMSVFA